MGQITKTMNKIWANSSSKPWMKGAMKCWWSLEMTSWSPQNIEISCLPLLERPRHTKQNWQLWQRGKIVRMPAYTLNENIFLYPSCLLCQVLQKQCPEVKVKACYLFFCVLCLFVLFFSDTHVIAVWERELIMIIIIMFMNKL